MNTFFGEAKKVFRPPGRHPAWSINSNRIQEASTIKNTKNKFEAVGGDKIAVKQKTNDSITFGEKEWLNICKTVKQ
ncbi:hypothetical protein ACO0LF_17690 [Undibacterium sp. Di27W]|uniref:hypothetical protein n=1 Tax=Undibacterium sp. Di27W TaxID=3413036 RepID=UPI003BEFB57E